jgi:protein-disulfide isomerase
MRLALIPWDTVPALTAFAPRGNAAQVETGNAAQVETGNAAQVETGNAAPDGPGKAVPRTAAFAWGHRAGETGASTSDERNHPMRRRHLLALGAFLPAGALAQGLTPEQRQEVLDILRRALREDPSILRDAFQSIEEAEARDREAAQRRALQQNADALFRDPADPIKGNPQGRVTIVEFFDARCGFCKQLHPTMEQLLARERDVRVVLKDLPILGPNSVLASRALIAAQRQNQYLPLYDALLRLREEPTEPVLRREAERLRLDWARLRRDMDDAATTRRIEQNLALARALDIQGTPALIVGDTLFPGAADLPTLQRLTARARG